MIFNYSGSTGFLQKPSEFSSHEWLSRMLNTGVRE